MQNKVVLLGYYGGDERHCISAWQSTNIELDIKLTENIKQRINQLYEATVINKKKTSLELLKFLAEHNHHTPFEKSCLDFQITGDLASHIHNLKHRIATSINSESARYKELKDKWFLPEDWKEVQTITNKTVASNYSFAFDFITAEFAGFETSWFNVLDSFSKLSHQLYHLSCEQLTPKLGRKRAKESSRYFLNYNKQLDYDCMFNFRSFVHFQELRNSEHAQLEIKDIAQQMLDLVKNIPDNPFQYSLAAFNL